MLKRTLLGAVIVCAVLSGCSAPAVHHVGNTTAGLFFDVPREWSSIDEALLKKAETGWSSSEAGSALIDSLTWQTAWVADASLSASDVFSNTAHNSPVVYASSRTLYSAEKAGIGTDVLAALQDIVLPVSTATSNDGLSVDVNRSFSRNGYQGIEQQLRWVTDGVEQQVNSTIILNKDSSQVFVVTARCSVACVAAYGDDINSILSSITIKEPSGA